MTRSVSINVLKKGLVISAEDKTKVYGAAPPAATLAYAGFVNGDAPGSLDTPAAADHTATAASNVGAYPINVSGAADVNYDITFAPGTLTITRADLTITAEDKTKVYGTALPAATLAYSGFVNGDTPGSLDTPAAATHTATAASSAGAYPININGAVDLNYSINLVAGTLTITPASTTGSLTSSANPALPGQLVTFTYTLSQLRREREHQRERFISRSTARMPAPQ